MRLELPKPGNGRGDDARMMYAAATMATTRAGMMREAGYGSAANDVMFTLPRMFDPSRRGMMGTSYGSYGGDINLLEFDENEEIRKKVLLGCRNIAKTHPVVNSCISVYSRYPLAGISLNHADADLERFYTELFIEDLDFENFLIDLGKSFWTDGTSFVYGNWSDSLGLWVGEDLLDPLTMRVERVPFAAEDVVYMVPQDDLKEFARGQTPEGVMFRSRYPEMADAIMRGEDIPISMDRLTMIANKDRPSELWGTPVLLRAWNTLRLEDRMQQAMQATADRLYAPLIMFTIGGQLPDGTTFIPSAAMLDAFRTNLDAALASEFRAIVTHDGVKAVDVIKGDRLQTFKNDMDMYDDRIFMAFGLSSSILKPQTGTYATSALELQLATQMMASYQKMLIAVYNKQAAFIAAAQEHYEYEKKGDSSEVVTERKEVWDPDAGDGEGAYVVKDVPKLSYPKMTFDVINFRDEQKEREFRMALRNAGVPIADDDIAIGVDIDLADSADKYNDEQVKKKVDEARRTTAIFDATMKQGYVVPPDAKEYMERGIPPFRLKSAVDSFRDEDDAADHKLDLKYDNEVANDMMDGLFDDSEAVFDSDVENQVKQRPDESDDWRGSAPTEFNQTSTGS